MKANLAKTNLVGRLACLDTCAVSDALDRMQVRGVAFGLAPLSVPKRIVGHAVTVRLGPDDRRETKQHLCTRAVEASGPGRIIVIANEGRTNVAGWGGILSVAASIKGTEGVVIDGACRDIDESRAVGLAVYGRAAVPVTARGRVVELEWNVPIVVCGQSVTPGDLVIADGSGVVFLRGDLAEAAIGEAEKIAEKERLIAEAVRNGVPVSQAMGANYESMLRR